MEAGEEIPGANSRKGGRLDGVILAQQAIDALRVHRSTPQRRRTVVVDPVHLDGCLEVDAGYWAAPPDWIGHQVHMT
jgi:hypothetical protein